MAVYPDDPAQLDLITIVIATNLVGLLPTFVNVLQLSDDILSGDDLSKDDMLAVQVWRGYGGDEELGAVGVGASIGHGQQQGTIMLRQGT